MGKLVVCYIQAFDCEKTIEAAMDSVRRQTYDNWLCFVLSNGNRNLPEAPNYSFDIIKATASRDKRFVVLNKKYNYIDMYIPMLYHLANHFPDSYICSLDADDEYAPDFFERAADLAESEKLDIVACGTEIVLKKRTDAKDETLLSRRELHENLIIRGEDFTSKFRTYKPFFNEMWGKLYNTGLFGDKYNWNYAQKNFFLHFLPDTLFTIDNLSRSKAVGVLSGTSHKFYQFEQRQSTNATVIANEYAANHQRKLLGRNTFSVYKTYDTVIDYLKIHGEIDADLYEYMQAVLFGWFNDYYNRTLILTTNEAKLADHVMRFISDPKFDELMQYKGLGKFDNISGYQPRIDFCVKLKNLMMCQKVICNRTIGKKKNILCSHRTVCEIEKICDRIDQSIQKMKSMQEEIIKNVG